MPDIGYASALGILNIYPFLWMASTSLKTSAESKSAKEVLVPALKYNLAPGSTQATWPEARLNEAQLEMLGILHAEDERRRRLQLPRRPPRRLAPHQRRRRHHGRPRHPPFPLLPAPDRQ